MARFVLQACSSARFPPRKEGKVSMNRAKLTLAGCIACDSKQVVDDPMMFLPFQAELEEGYTLRSYFQLICRYPVLQELNAVFPAYRKRYSECPPAGCETKDFNHLELNKTIEMVGVPGESTYLSIYPSLRGVSGNDSLDLEPYRLEELLDMPLRLGGLDHIIFGGKLDVFRFDTVFNLFEFIDGIARQPRLKTGPTLWPNIHVSNFQTWKGAVSTMPR